MDKERLKTIAELEIDKLYEEFDIEEEIPRDNIQVVTVGWKCRLGQCLYDAMFFQEHFDSKLYGRIQEEGMYVIALAQRLPAKEVTMTTRHELAHAVVHAMGYPSGHNVYWKRMAKAFGTNPRAKNSRAEPEYKYWYGCPNGCWKKKYIRKVDRVRNASEYTCGSCGSTCESGELE